MSESYLKNSKTNIKFWNQIKRFAQIAQYKNCSMQKRQRKNA